MMTDLQQLYLVDMPVQQNRMGYRIAKLCREKQITKRRTNDL